MATKNDYETGVMGFSAIIAGLLLAQSAAPAITVEGGGDRIDVAYSELRGGDNTAAIARIEAGSFYAEGDPSALINLGTAYARLGEQARANDLYRSAIASRIRYDLQLADGTWMDSRRAARLARERLGSPPLLVVR